MTTLCVFCGSRVGSRPVYAEAARQRGTALVARGMDLMYGGGHVGLPNLDSLIDEGLVTLERVRVILYRPNRGQ